MKLAPNAEQIIDFVIGDGGMVIEDTLQTAIIISLFTDRRAGVDDNLPEGNAVAGLVPPNRRGWCGDALSDAATNKIGSRLWLLQREKQTEETRRRAIFYIKEALQWLLDDGHAVSFTVEAEWSSRGRLDALIAVVDHVGTSKTYKIGDVYVI